MKIAYFSPLSPDPSGISDFSEELLPELKQYLDIDLFARKEPTNKCITNKFQVYKIEEFDNPELRGQYDEYIYQVGNNIIYHGEIINTFLKYPGILELHDFSLHHYLAEKTYAQGDNAGYIETMKYCHGKKGEKVAREFVEGKIGAPWEDQSDKFPVNKYLIDKAKAIIVHSDMAKQMVKGIRPDAKVINIPLHTFIIDENPREYMLRCRKQLNIAADILVMGSFGYANRSKRIIPIMEALAKIKAEYSIDFKYYIVGKIQESEIQEAIHKLGLDKNVVVTGFVDMTDFEIYMGICDFCFNLRYPTQGESSASLHRMLGMGKPALVTKIGSFEEYPDSIVVKISHGQDEMNDIYNAVLELYKDRRRLQELSQNALKYAAEHYSLGVNIKRYYNFLVDIKEETYEDLYEDTLLDRLYCLGVANIDTYFDFFLEKHIKKIDNWNLIL